jgi:hypothetical protein
LLRNPAVPKKWYHKIGNLTGSYILLGIYVRTVVFVNYPKFRDQYLSCKDFLGLWRYCLRSLQVRLTASIPQSRNPERDKIIEFGKGENADMAVMGEGRRH